MWLSVLDQPVFPEEPRGYCPYVLPALLCRLFEKSGPEVQDRAGGAMSCPLAVVLAGGSLGPAGSGVKSPFRGGEDSFTGEAVGAGRFSLSLFGWWLDGFGPGAGLPVPPA